MTKRGAYVSILIAMIVLIALGSAAYFLIFTKDVLKRDSGNQTQTPASSTPATDTVPGTDAGKTYRISVYFSKHPDSDDDPGKTFPVARTSPDLRVGKYAIQQLLNGPNDTEKAQGYFATARIRGGASTCDNNDFSLTIKDGTATLQFCRQFDHIGSVSDGQAESEIKTTLKQFSSVQKVIILNSSGDCEFNLSGLNLCKQQ